MFWRGVLGYLPVNLVQALAGFGSIAVFTRILTPQAYGQYALAFSVVALVHMCVFTWLEAAMARFYPAEPEGDARANLFATIYRAFPLVALAAIGPAALILVFAPVSATLKFAVAAGLLAAIARSLLKLAQERRRAAGRVQGYAVFDMVQTGGGFALGAMLALAGLGASAPFAGAGAATAICLIWALRPELAQGQGGRFDPQRLRAYASYGVPLSLSLVLSLTLASTDRFVLAAFSGEEAVAAYHAAYNLSSRTLDIIFLWVTMAGAPAMVAALEQGGETALQQPARQKASLMLFLTVPASVGLALVSAPLSELMIGEGLSAGAARVTPWIAIGALFGGLTVHYLNHSFALARRTRLQLVAFGIPAAANLALCLILIPRFGLIGAAWATTASYAFAALTSYVMMRRCLRLPIPWGTAGRVLLATAAMGAAVSALPDLGGLPELMLKAGVGAAVYAAAALVLDAAGARTGAARLLRGLLSRRRASQGELESTP